MNPIVSELGEILIIVAGLVWMFVIGMKAGAEAQCRRRLSSDAADLDRRAVRARSPHFRGYWNPTSRRLTTLAGGCDYPKLLPGGPITDAEVTRVLWDMNIPIAGKASVTVATFAFQTIISRVLKARAAGSKGPLVAAALSSNLGANHQFGPNGGMN